MPLNVDDAALDASNPPEDDANHWTDVTLSRIRFEYVAFSRDLRAMLLALEKKESTITIVLRKVEEFRRDMEKKFLHMMDETVAIQAFALRILRLEGSKLHIRVLNRYAVSAPQAMPLRLRQVVWFSGTALIEIGVDIDTSLRFKEWAWYSGAIQQYHTALLLLTEVWNITDRRLVDRIWHCFDYIFELPKFFTRTEKTNFVVNKAKSRLDEYQKRRKYRIPVEMQRRMNSVTSPGLSRRGLTASPQAQQVESDEYITPKDFQSISPVRLTSTSLQGSPGASAFANYDYSTPSSSSAGGGTNRFPSQNHATGQPYTHVPELAEVTIDSTRAPFPVTMTDGFHDQQLYDEMNVDWVRYDQPELMHLSVSCLVLPCNNRSRRSKWQSLLVILADVFIG